MIYFIPSNHINQFPLCYMSTINKRSNIIFLANNSIKEAYHKTEVTENSLCNGKENKLFCNVVRLE